MNKDKLDDTQNTIEDISSMLHDLSKCQSGILTKIDELNEIDCNRTAEFKGAQKEVLNELNTFRDSLQSSLNNDEASKIVSPSLNIAVTVSVLLIIVAMTIGTLSLYRLNTLNNEWEIKIQQKMHEADSLDQVIDLFEKQKEGLHAAGQPD